MTLPQVNTAQYRAQLFPISPTRAQTIYLAKAAGTARFVYNWALSEWKRQAVAWWDSGKTEPFPSVYALNKQFNALRHEAYPWVSDVAADLRERAILAVGQAFEAYKAGDSRYPRAKKRSGRRSFVASSRGQRIHIAGPRVTLPRVGSLRLGSAVRWAGATPVSAVISMRADRWYVSISFKIETPEQSVRSGSAGVDLGIKTPLVVASGDATLHLGTGLSERLKVERRKLRRANRRLSRRHNGSGRRERARKRVARIHQRMANIRSDVQHKATCQISRMASRVGVETLAVRNLMQNGRLARAIADVGFYEIKRQLKYKADHVVEADRFYPSSKTCSSCGSIKQSLKLSDRVFRCEHCGHECDRDVNAARNLERMAANCAVSARGARSPARRRKLTLSSLAGKREAQREDRS